MNEENLTVEQELEEIDRINNLVYDAHAEEQVRVQFELAQEVQHGQIYIQEN